MDRSTSDYLAVALAVFFWVFMLTTPVGGEILDFMLGFYESFAP